MMKKLIDNNLVLNAADKGNTITIVNGTEHENKTLQPIKNVNSRFQSLIQIISIILK